MKLPGRREEWRALALAAIFLISFTAPARADEASAAVRALTDAFNRHDVESMRSHWSPDVIWYDVSGDQTSIVAKGVDAMVDGMRKYFESYPDARSAVSDLIENGPYVTGVETAYWTSKGVPRAQSSVVVYEIRDEKVRRVWYYPAERKGPP
jgi:hypothetical protein